MAIPERAPVFDVECPECRFPKAILTDEHPWCYFCPECEHVWDATPVPIVAEES